MPAYAIIGSGEPCFMPLYLNKRTDEYCGSAEDILEKNQADFVAIGRALFADHDWAMKAKTGKVDRIRGCIQCSDMCAGNTFTNKCAT